MRTLIKAVKIVDPTSKWHQKKVDVWIEDGKIHAIDQPQIGKADFTFEGKSLHLSGSWLDMRVSSGEPGEEYREDLDSLCRLLEAGGFASALLMPNTRPVIQTKSDIKNIISGTRQQLVSLLPTAAVSKDCEGDYFNEMLDLHHAGTVAFTDGSQPLWNSDLLVKTLQYLQKFDGLLINFPQDQKLGMFGQMNESAVSTGLGLKGIPNLAEEIMIQRDLELLRYAGGKIHFSCLSSAKSVALIKEAKKQGLQVTCDVSINHLILDDSRLETFDTNYKVLPPLRSKNDIQALIAGVNDGTIDVIVSNHQPFDQDHKQMEFDLAEFGMMGSQVLFPLYHKYLSAQIELDTFIACISSNAKRILSLEQSSITEGANTSFTLFSLDSEWTFNADTNQSKSENSPFFGESFNAKAIAVFNGPHYYMDKNYPQLS